MDVTDFSHIHFFILGILIFKVRIKHGLTFSVVQFFEKFRLLWRNHIEKLLFSAYNSIEKSLQRGAMMLLRKMESLIEDYLQSDSKKILLIDGAHQVGKTYSTEYRR